MRVKDKVALVTGAGGPMGEAVAQRLAEDGASLVLTDISGNRLNAAAGRVRQALAPGAALVAHRADVRRRDEAAAVVEAGRAALAPIDILVNVVGGIRAPELFKPILEMDEQRWDDTLELNLKGTFHLVQLLVPGMLERRYGRVINFASINFAGEYGQADYGAAKAAVASLTRSLAMEFAPAVTVNCIAPGTIRTSVLERMPDEHQQRYREKAWAKRLGEPRDIANAVLYLASDEAGYVTGEILAVSGGIWPAL